MEIEYETEWHLNDGKTPIPLDAEVLKAASGAVVAYRKAKQKPWVFGEVFKVHKTLWSISIIANSYADQDGYLTGVFVREKLSIAGKPSILFAIADFSDGLIECAKDSPYIKRLNN